MLEICRPKSLDSLDHAIQQLANASVDGITFSSSNGVDGFMERLMELGHDARQLQGCQLATVGPATAKALHRFGLRADVLPDAASSYSAEALLEQLGTDLADSHWIVTTTNRSRATLARGLEERRAKVTEALCYETRPVKQLSFAVESALKAGRIQLCTITSSAIAETAYELLGPYRELVQPIGLSRQISERLRQLAWPPASEAKQHSSESLVEAVLTAWERCNAD